MALKDPVALAVPPFQLREQDAEFGTSKSSGYNNYFAGCAYQTRYPDSAISGNTWENFYSSPNLNDNTSKY